MKTTISLPDEVHYSAKRWAKRLDLSVSEIYAKAIRSFITQQEGKLIRRANKVCAKVDTSPGQSHSLFYVLTP